MRLISIVTLLLYITNGSLFAFDAEYSFRIRERLTTATRNPSWENIEKIAISLRGIARNMDQNNPIDQTLYHDVQAGITSVSGYANYFTTELERKRKQTEHLPFGVGERSSIPGLRATYIRDTFPHLPGPETIRALGAYLYDDFDTPPPPRPYQDAGDIPANSVLASNALTRIGLIDPPRHNLNAQKKWWEQVKAGKRWFAFHGQPVSYRFRPDGTLETKSRDSSRDAPWIVEVNSFDFIPEPDIPASHYWWVGCGAGLLLIGGGTLLWRRRKNRMRLAA